jgi:hypothetical protein
VSLLSDDERALALEYGFEVFTNDNGQEFVRKHLKPTTRFVIVLPPRHYYGSRGDQDARWNANQWCACTLTGGVEYEFFTDTLAAAIVRVHLEGWL